MVGGDGADALALADALYEQLVVRTVPVSSAATAEAVKLTENIFRAVNIALVNELKVVYAAMGIDIWEVIDAAKTKPFGFMPFYPGPGPRRPLHPDRPVLPDLEGPRIRHRDPLHRARRRDQHARCRYQVVDQLAEALDRTGEARLRGLEDPAPRHRLQEERRRHAREPLAQAHRADRGAWRRASTITTPSSR